MRKMDSELQVLGVGCSSSAFVSVLASIQIDDVLKYVNIALAILSTLVALAFTLFKWFKEAKKDGKITPDEVIDAVNKVGDIVDDAKSTIDKLGEKKGEKKDEKSSNSRGEN